MNRLDHRIHRTNGPIGRHSISHVVPYYRGRSRLDITVRFSRLVLRPNLPSMCSGSDKVGGWYKRPAIRALPVTSGHRRVSAGPAAKGSIFHHLPSSPPDTLRVAHRFGHSYEQQWQPWHYRSWRYNLARRSNCALMATITVLSDIRMAPTAGESKMPTGASTPAASGSATTL